MNRILTTVVIGCGLVAAATGEAAAASAAYCNQVAQNAVQTYTHPVGNAALGCIAGGALGSLLTKGNGGGVGVGCVAGAGTALVLTDSQRKKIYDDAYYNCMGSYPAPAPYPAPMAQPIPAGPPPSGSATVYQSLNVRQGPDTSYGIVYTLSPNMTVPVSSCTPDWCSVSIPGGSGWAYRKYLFFN